MDMQDPIAIEFADLTLGYDRHPAVHHLTGGFARGVTTVVLGPNGAGKSTLLKGIGGLLAPLGGRIRLHGFAARDIAHLPQLAEIDRFFPISIFDFVALGLWRRIGAFGGIGNEERRKVGAALAAVGLEGFERRAIGTLSGGQMQRAMFARLVVQDATVILLDEPFNAVDRRTTEDLIDLVRRWHAEGRTVVMVLHDHDIALRLARDALLIAREKVGFGPVGEVIAEENLARARRMIESFDDHAHICHRPAA